MIRNGLVYRVSAACAGCGACLGSCPPRSVRVCPDRVPPLRVDVGSCTGCGLCVEVCPVDAFVEVELPAARAPGAAPVAAVPAGSGRWGA